MQHELSKATVLFVDDEPNVLASIRRNLRRHARELVLEFAGGVDEALKILATTSIDVVVTDVNMPLKTGFDLIEAMTADPTLAHIPVIVLTGNAEVDLKRRALDLGAADLLSKPSSSEDILARLRSVLRIKQSQDELRKLNSKLESLVELRTAALERARMELVWRLGLAGEFRDNETGNHVLRVGYYCRRIADELCLRSDFCDLIFLTSPLHDVGKIGVPDGILLKPARLTPDEWQIMQRHTEYGAAMLQAEFVDPRLEHLGRQRPSVSVEAGETNPFANMAAQIALQHHEKWNGSGYPQRLAGKAISIEARITAVADVFDALGSVRPYKKAWADADILELFNKERGEHFDPAIVDAALAAWDDLCTIREQLADEPGEASNEMDPTGNPKAA